MSDAGSRRDARRHWPGRVYERGQEPGEDLSEVTTAAQRIEMVWELSARMWELSGRPIPQYDRASMPGRVIRPA